MKGLHKTSMLNFGLSQGSTHRGSEISKFSGSIANRTSDAWIPGLDWTGWYVRLNSSAVRVLGKT